MEIRCSNSQKSIVIAKVCLAGSLYVRSHSSNYSEYSQAVDYVSRALYAYERAFLGAFSFTGGNNRLDFDRVENRPFFLAIHRQVM